MLNFTIEVEQSYNEKQWFNKMTVLNSFIKEPTEENIEIYNLFLNNEIYN